MRRLLALWLDAADEAAIRRAAVGRAAGVVGIVAPGNLFVATWQLVMEALALGGTAVVRASGRDRDSVAVLIAQLRLRAPALADRVEVLHFTRDDDAGWAAFLRRIDSLVAQGSDAAMSALLGRVARLRPALPVRTHGHRLSWVWAGPAGALGLEERGEASDADGTAVAAARAVIAHADAIAHDTLLADGRGCMAPRAVLLGGDIADVAPLATALEAAFTRHAAAFPAGALPADLLAQQRGWIEEQRFEAAMAGLPFQAIVRSGFAVVIVGGPRPTALQPRDLGPGGRLLVVRPAPLESTAWAALGALTSTVALLADDGEVAAQLERIGVRRCCAPGRMQAPPWSRTSDGAPLGAVIAPRGDASIHRP